MSLIDLMGYKIYCGDIKDVLISKKKIVINTINPHSYVVAKKDKVFCQALKDADYLLPDGVGFVFASMILKQKNINRITGADIHEHLIKLLEISSGKCFYLGSSENVLSVISEKQKKLYPNILIEFFSPIYTEKFDEAYTESVISRINKFSPDVLFVGMTAPKQEKWVYENRWRIEAKIICSIGAVFDFYSGNVKRAPIWMMNLGMEWLHRSFKSLRLAKRNIRSNPIFLCDLIKEFVK